MGSGSSNCSYNRDLFTGKPKRYRFRDVFTINESSLMIKFCYHFSLLYWSKKCCLFSTDSTSVLNGPQVQTLSLQMIYVQLYISCCITKEFLLTIGKINSLILNVSIFLRYSGFFFGEQFGKPTLNCNSVTGCLMFPTCI